MDLFDSQRQGRLRDPASFCKGPICHENPGTPLSPLPEKTRGDLIFRLYNKWISYILWSDLTASLSKLMCWKTIFLWDFGHFLRGELLNTLIFGGFLLTYLAAWYLCRWSIFTSKLHFGGLWCGLLPTSTRISTKVHLDILPKTNSFPSKSMVGRWISFWDGLFSGANCWFHEV